MLERVKGIARAAGALLLDYHGKRLDVQYKTDMFDPVTEADHASDRAIQAALREHFPDDQILSEEREAPAIDWGGRVWVIDPLDGTKYFVREMNDFGVAIGLCVGGRPVLGVVYLPFLDELYAAEHGKGAYRELEGRAESIHVTNTERSRDARFVVRYDLGEQKPYDAVVSRALQTLGSPSTITAGSTVRRLMLIAAGEADAFISPSLHTMKWDTCGAEAILREAGGNITDYDGKALDYAQPSPSWTRSYVASNGRLHAMILRSIQ